MKARMTAIKTARRLHSEYGLHKQIVNRIVEPWMWITAIATGTNAAWENFFSLRCHPAAEPHMQKIAYMARDEYDRQEPFGQILGEGEWHLPLIPWSDLKAIRTVIDSDERQKLWRYYAKISTARCARVSYLTHQKERTHADDIDFHNKLERSKHWSPFEHCAQASSVSLPHQGGNFGTGWIQYRKMFPGENCRKAPRSPEWHAPGIPV
jgi:hypothetical protein